MKLNKSVICLLICLLVLV